MTQILRFQWVLIFLVFSLFTSGCAVSLPFSNRVTYSTIQEAKSFTVDNKGPISVKWIPADFTERIDVQGASGFVGGGSRTRIPTGIALSSRITEILDTMIGVKGSAEKVLTISVIKAESKFEYSAGIFNVTPALDVGKCFFEAEFLFTDSRWTEKFTAERKDPEIGGTSQTGILEQVWDDIALQVGKNVIQRMK